MYIQTERLVLRPLRSADGAVFASMAKDGDLKDVGFDEGCGEWMEAWTQEAMRFAQRDDPRQDYIANTVCLSDGTVIGSVGCSWYEDLTETGITYFIGREYRKQGYATECVRAYADWALSHYALPRLIATIREENVPSWRTIESIGFTCTETKLYRDIGDEAEVLYRFYEKKT